VLFLVDEDLKSLKGAVYFQWTYRWMIDFVNELSHMLGDVRAYSRGIFGTYPWERYQSRTYVLSARSYVTFLVDFLRYKPDISILLASETFIALSIFVLAKLVKSRIVLVVEENEERAFHSLGLKVLAKFKRTVVVMAHKSSDLIIAESQASKEYLLRMGCNPAIIFSLPHGVNTDDFQPERKNLELAHRIGMRPEDLRKNVVLFVGNYNAYKGAEFMTEAILNFPSDGRVVFLIPRSGPVFLKHADELKALPHLYAYPPIDDQQMPDLYNLADIIVVPSMRCPGTSSDRSPNSLTEAMACGKAVIGTAVGGIPLIMGTAGLLIAPNESNAIVEALLTLVGDAELRIALGNKARERAVTELSNKVYAERILELLSRASAAKEQQQYI
jgi:glycosyltransferase involved in cell wall biosynthesis